MSPRRTRSHMVTPNPLLGRRNHQEEVDRSEVRPNRDRGKQPAPQASNPEAFVTYEQFESMAQQLTVLTRFVQGLQTPPVEATSRPPLGVVPPMEPHQEAELPQNLPRHRPAKSGGRPTPPRTNARPAPELSGTGSTSQHGRISARDRLGPQPRPAPRVDEDGLEELLIPRRITIPEVAIGADKPNTPMDPEGLGHVPIP